MAKLSLCLINEAPCHEDVLERGGIAPPFLTLALDEGEQSASYPGCFTYWLRSGPKRWYGCCGEEKNLLPLPGIPAPTVIT
jgi:hypothetical protein